MAFVLRIGCLHRTALTKIVQSKSQYYPRYYRPVCLAVHRSFSVNQLKRSGSSSHGNIIKSKNPDLDLIEDKSFPEFLFDKFATFGNKTALIDGITRQQYTYPQLQDMTIKLGSALTQLGVKKGDVCAIFCHNIVEYPIISLSILSLGGIATLVSPMATVPELTRQLNDTKAQYIFTVPAVASIATETAKQCGVKEVFVVGEAEGCRPISDLFKDDGKMFPYDVEINPKDDLAIFPYSSGTTGLPKGVMLTHFNLTANIQQLTDIPGYIGTTFDDSVLCVLPLFHIFGFTVVMGTTLRRGATLVNLPKFELELFLGTVQNFKISAGFVVPPIILLLAKSPVVNSYDITSLRYLLCGAAPLSEDLESAFFDCHETIKLVQGYGLTELSPGAIIGRVTDPRKPGSSGVPLPNTEVKVIDLTTGETLGANERGEIFIRGPQTMKGYYNNPKATNETIDSDGWLHSGDIGYYDSDGYFYILDRCKELIKYKGFQVAPGELEAVLLSHPNIQDAAVIGIPDEECGELPKGFIVAKDINEEEIHSYLQENLSTYKQLRGGIDFVEAIPKSPSGKILRTILREQELSK